MPYPYSQPRLGQRPGPLRVKLELTMDLKPNPNLHSLEMDSK